MRDLTVSAGPLHRASNEELDDLATTLGAASIAIRHAWTAPETRDICARFGANLAVIECLADALSLEASRATHERARRRPLPAAPGVA